MNHSNRLTYLPDPPEHREKLSVAQRARLGLPPFMSRLYGVLIPTTRSIIARPMVAEIARKEGFTSAQSLALRLLDLTNSQTEQMVYAFFLESESVRREARLHRHKIQWRARTAVRDRERELAQERRAALREEQMNQVMVLLNEDVPIEEIARVLGRQPSTVRRWLTEK